MCEHTRRSGTHLQRADVQFEASALQFKCKLLVCCEDLSRHGSSGGSNSSNNVGWQRRRQRHCIQNTYMGKGTWSHS